MLLEYNLKYKCLRFIVAVLSLPILLNMSLVVNATSINDCKLQATPYGIQEQNDFLDRINLRVSKSELSNNSTIVNMDVSENGYVAVALENEAILVYDDKGNYIKKFDFEAKGSYFVKWNGNNLVLIYVRGNSVVEFTLDCEIIGAFHISLPSEAIREMRDKTATSVNGEKYELKSKLFFTGYTKLVKIDEAGNTIILYSTNAVPIVANIIIAVIFVMGITIIPFVILRKQIKAKNRHN